MCSVTQSCLTLCDHMNCSCQAPLSAEFSRQEDYSGLPSPTPENLPDPGIKPTSLVSPAPAGRFFTTEPPGKLPGHQLTRNKNSCYHFVPLWVNVILNTRVGCQSFLQGIFLTRDQTQVSCIAGKFFTA